MKVCLRASPVLPEAGYLWGGRRRNTEGLSGCSFTHAFTFIYTISESFFSRLSRTMDQIVLFGDSITQQSFSQQKGFGFGAELSDRYARRLDVIK